MVVLPQAVSPVGSPHQKKQAMPQYVVVTFATHIAFRMGCVTRILLFSNETRKSFLTCITGEQCIVEDARTRPSPLELVHSIV